MALTREGKFPLTLIVLDEVQQYIGGDPQRSLDVQETVEACCKNIGAKLLFIGTGQTAVTGTSNLKRLEGRFTIRIELSDADVDAVIRKVILAKKADAAAPVAKVMENNLGEISRHLSGTTIGHQQDDIPWFSQDYPLLPVRRRFWENTLRVLDQTGTDSQLRNQLSMIHKVIQTNLDEPLGHVVPADYLYYDSADKLLQSRILPRKVHEKTMKWRKGSPQEQLLGRACGLVFLINKLAAGHQDIGIRATIDTLADLMVENLPHGSSDLRSQLPKLLDTSDLLMKVGEEYRIQTEESAAWSDEFSSQRSALANEIHRIEAERDDRIRKKFGELVGKQVLTQGSAKVSREISPIFDADLPVDAKQRICVWVRNGWGIDENAVRADARQVGNQSPTVFVFIPKRSADDLRHHLINWKAAAATLEKRGIPNTPEGTEARSAMETTRQTAEAKINDLLGDAFSGAKVFQGGGSEIMGNRLQDMVLEAAENALQRLYPQFAMADHSGWAKVYEKARTGAPDALKAVGDDGDPSKNPVCKAILGYIAGGKNGADIRKYFESPPYGWSRDAVDGGLQVLLVSGMVRAQDTHGKPVDPKDLDRKSIGKILFKVESTTVTTAQRIQIRKLFQKAGLKANPGEEHLTAPQFLEKMLSLAAQAGGDPPRPALPDIAFLHEIRLAVGNEQLLALYNQREKLGQCMQTWNELAQRIETRIKNWERLKHLAMHVQGMTEAEAYVSQIKNIGTQRQLLAEPDLIPPLIKQLTQLLRDALNQAKSAWDREWQAGESRLKEDANWQQLEPEQRHELRFPHGLVEAACPAIEVDTTDAILRTLGQTGLTALKDRIAAMSGRYDQILLETARLLEPELQKVSLPARTLKTQADVDAWLEQTRKLLMDKLSQGPILV